MKSASECELKQKFEEIDRVYSINRDEIEKVKNDFEMIIDGWNINFAVDFFQIYNFASKNLHAGIERIFKHPQNNSKIRRNGNYI